MQALKDFEKKVVSGGLGFWESLKCGLVDAATVASIVSTVVVAILTFS